MNNNSKFLPAVIVSSVLAFLGGWLIFGIIFSDYYSSAMTSQAVVLLKTPMNLWATAISTLAGALLFTWVVQKTNNMTFARGFTASLWVSFLLMTIFNLSVYASWNIYDIGFVIGDIGVGAIFWGLIGGVAGAILGTDKKKEVEVHRTTAATV